MLLNQIVVEPESPHTMASSVRLVLMASTTAAGCSGLPGFVFLALKVNSSIIFTRGFRDLTRNESSFRVATRDDSPSTETLASPRIGCVTGMCVARCTGLQSIFTIGTPWG